MEIPHRLATVLVLAVLLAIVAALPPQALGQSRPTQGSNVSQQAGQPWVGDNVAFQGSSLPALSNGSTAEIIPTRCTVPNTGDNIRTRDLATDEQIIKLNSLLAIATAIGSTESHAQAVAALVDNGVIEDPDGGGPPDWETWRGRYAVVISVVGFLRKSPEELASSTYTFIKEKAGGNEKIPAVEVIGSDTASGKAAESFFLTKHVPNNSPAEYALVSAWLKNKDGKAYESASDIRKNMDPGCALRMKMQSPSFDIGFSKIINSPGEGILDLTTYIMRTLGSAIYNFIAEPAMKLTFFTPHVERGESFMDIPGMPGGPECAAGVTTITGQDCLEAQYLGYDKGLADNTSLTRTDVSWIQWGLLLRSVATAGFFLILVIAAILFMVKGDANRNLHVLKLIPRLVLATLAVLMLPVLFGWMITLSNRATVGVLGGADNNCFVTGDCQTSPIAVIALTLGQADFIQGDGGIIQAALVLIASVFIAALGVIAIARQLLLIILVVLLPIAVIGLLTDTGRNWFKQWAKASAAVIFLPVIMAAILRVGNAVNPLTEAFDGLSTDPITNTERILGSLVLLAMLYAMIKCVRIARNWVMETPGSVGVFRRGYDRAKSATSRTAMLTGGAGATAVPGGALMGASMMSQGAFVPDRGERPPKATVTERAVRSLSRPGTRSETRGLGIGSGGGDESARAEGTDSLTGVGGFRGEAASDAPPALNPASEGGAYSSTSRPGRNPSLGAGGAGGGAENAGGGAENSAGAGAGAGGPSRGVDAETAGEMFGNRGGASARPPAGASGAGPGGGRRSARPSSGGTSASARLKKDESLAPGKTGATPSSGPQRAVKRVERSESSTSGSGSPVSTGSDGRPPANPSVENQRSQERISRATRGATGGSVGDRLASAQRQEVSHLKSMLADAEGEDRQWISGRIAELERDLNS